MSIEKRNIPNPNETRTLTRRKFLATLAGMGAGLVAGSVTGVEYPNLKKLIRETVSDKNELRGETESLIEKIKEKYGFEVSFTVPNDYVNQINNGHTMYVTGEPLNAIEKRDGIMLLFLAVSVYPPEYIKNIGLEKIVLVNDLRIAKFSNLPKDSQKSVAGFTDAQNNFYISFSAGTIGGWLNDFMVNEGIHHELYHLANYKEDGNVYIDRDWFNLNPDGENDYDIYRSSDGKLHRGEIPGEIVADKIKRRARHVGFSETYGMTDIAEDKATIAEALITHNTEIMEKCSKDKILAEKVKRIKADYYKWTQGKFNNAFWNDLENGKIKADYWDTKR